MVPDKILCELSATNNENICQGVLIANLLCTLSRLLGVCKFLIQNRITSICWKVRPQHNRVFVLNSLEKKVIGMIMADQLSLVDLTVYVDNGNDFKEADQNESHASHIVVHQL